ncbi:MAG: cyclic nucleotide-binding protein [Micavibrio sp. TMED27]|nr:cyclic nucleotide-binding protein [Micavibrio sp.]OUT90734.1 MAG: cyclic nucleotide-binding protein [Micavibrio sp. TMED27]|tara:strand:- start:1781 stop:2983 length:1203 start_codon:yes stop_codon:yes gene_type:complete
MQKNQRFFSAGDTIIRQGDTGTSAYIIESGRVEIVIETDYGGEQLVGTRGAGAMIGEMAIIDRAPRTATIRAIENCNLLEITQDNFDQRIKNADPVLCMAIQVILARYRDVLKRAQVIGEPPRSVLDSEAQEMNMVNSDSSALEALKIINDFENSLDKGEVSLNYQPIMNLETGKVAGYEALMRWIHPERGFISPGIFIPALEDSGLIVKASQWALNESLQALKRIEGKVGYESHLFMSVNFTSHDFSEDGFVDSVYETISATDIQPNQLHIEITERLLMGQPDKAAETLKMCRNAGIGISIDDFGTGYSSLSYLHAFPIDTLKIDRSFVMEMEKDDKMLEMVRSIIGLGKNLGMKLIAEGIETENEAKLLKKLGCEYGQGYYFCPPVDENNVVKYTKGE